MKRSSSNSSRNTFVVALKHAEKELASKLKQRLEAQNIVGRLNYEIPNLQNMVRVLQAQLNPEAMPTQPGNGSLPPSVLAAIESLPPVKEVEPGMGSIPFSGEASTSATVPDIESVIPESAKDGWK
jgi:hypothetical protein